MWSMGKVFDNPEVVRVYLGSFWDKPLKHQARKTQSTSASFFPACFDYLRILQGGPYLSVLTRRPQNTIMPEKKGGGIFRPCPRFQT